MYGNTLIAGIADAWVGFKSLLNHHSERACEIGQFTLYEHCAKSDLGQKTFTRITYRPIRRAHKNFAGDRIPVLDGAEGKVHFFIEMVEEAASGDASRGTNVVDRSRGVALDTYDPQCGVEKFHA